MLPNFKIRSLLELRDVLQQDDYADLLEELKTHPVETIERITKQPDESELDDYDIRSIQQLKDKIQKDPRLVDLLKMDPVTFIQHLATKNTAPGV